MTTEKGTAARMRSDGMACPTCEHHVEQALREPGAQAAEANSGRAGAHVRAPKGVDPDQLVAALAATPH